MASKCELTGHFYRMVEINYIDSIAYLISFTYVFIQKVLVLFIEKITYT